MSSSLLYSASLLVITDDADEDSSRFTYILTLFSRKLKKLDIFLRKIFYITKHDYADIVQQFGLLLDTSQSHDWIFVTTTNACNDHLMERVLEDSRLRPDLGNAKF